MNQAGQLQLCAVMLAETRLVERKKAESAFVEAGVNIFFLYFGSYAEEGWGDNLLGRFLTPFYGLGTLWHPPSLGEYHQSERRLYRTASEGASSAVDPFRSRVGMPSCPELFLVLSCLSRESSSAGEVVMVCNVEVIF